VGLCSASPRAARALARIGLYGVVSASVAKRTREIRIRMALGAAPRRVARDVVVRGLGLVITGVGIGIGLALALAGGLDALVYGTSSRDPLTYATVGAVMVGVALLATVVPARRATRVAPAEALTQG